MPNAVHKRSFTKAPKPTATGAVLGYGRVSREGHMEPLARQAGCVRTELLSAQ